jgi:hypothetical protein
MAKSASKILNTNGASKGLIHNSTMSAAGASDAAGDSGKVEIHTAGQGQQGLGASFGQGFAIEPSSGVLRGRGLGLPNTQVVQVRFSPGHTRAAEVQLQVEVKHGRGCGLMLQGQGTYLEGYGPAAVPKAGLRR